ncbi:MAG: hypothetical protein J6L66_00525, partial [Anaerotignum sp.]|nr:hypothetical protein [Anaerotignum sp.]
IIKRNKSLIPDRNVGEFFFAKMRKFIFLQFWCRGGEWWRWKMVGDFHFWWRVVETLHFSWRNAWKIKVFP